MQVVTQFHGVVQGLLGVMILAVVVSTWVQVRSHFTMIQLRDQRLARIEQSLVEMIARIGLSHASGVRIEAAAAVVAEDLRLSHERADATTGAAGEAGDAAARSDPSGGH